MEPDLSENGLNLDPMRFWKYVRLEKHRTIPKAIIQVKKPIDIVELAKAYHEWVFFVMSDNMYVPNVPNIMIAWADAFKGDTLYKIYAQADYILSDIDSPETWLPAMLCGVTPVYDIDQLKQDLVRSEPISLVERIENWERGKDTLTFLTTSGIKEL